MPFPYPKIIVGKRHCRVLLPALFCRIGITFLSIAILNHLHNSCRGNPPVVAPRCWVGTGALPLQILMNHLGLL